MGKRYFEYVETSPPASETSMMIPGRTVFVRGFDSHTKPSLVKSLISSFEGLETWKLSTENKTAEANVIATFDSLENAQSFAYKLRKKSWNGANLTSEVFGGADNSHIKEELKKLVERKRGEAGKKTRMNETAKSGRVIVRNLPFNVDAPQLKKLFESAAFGVTDVQVPVMADGKKRGFAFVQFSKRQDAVNAVSKFHGHSIKGRPIAVDLSVSKEVHLKLTQKFGTSTTQHINNNSVGQNDDHHSQLKLGDDQYIGDEEQYNDCVIQDEGDDVIQDQDDDVMQEDDDEDHLSNIDDENDAIDFSDDHDDEDDDENGESDADEGDEPERKRRKKNRPSDVNEGKTLFIKGLPFNAEDEDLSDFFSRFGEVTMAKVVLDKETEESKGCGFIKFKELESVSKCLERINSQLGLIMERRKLSGEVAVSKQEAEKRKQEGNKKSQLASLVNDKRNLHLARVGLIRGEAVSKMSKHDLKLRDNIERLKKMKLRNSNIVVSATRLCIHNVPTLWNDKQLRNLCLEAAGGKSNGTNVTECRIMKAKTDKSVSGLGRSLGFAFVSFSTHQHALKALYALNDNHSVFSDQKRPVVEFSLENMLALQKKERRLLKAKMNLHNSNKQQSTGTDSCKKGAVSSNLNSQTLNYKSKKKLKKFARTPLFENSTDANAETSAKFDLPEAVISNMTAKELKQRLKNPMPKKTVSTSMDPKILRASFKKRKHALAAKRTNKQFALAVAEKRVNRSKKKNIGKYLKEPTRDKLDDVIERHMARRQN